MIEILLQGVVKQIRRNGVPKERRSEILRLLVNALTEMGVVVFYVDDLESRRKDPELTQDTPTPP